MANQAFEYNGMIVTQWECDAAVILMGMRFGDSSVPQNSQLSVSPLPTPPLSETPPPSKTPIPDTVALVPKLEPVDTLPKRQTTRRVRALGSEADARPMVTCEHCGDLFSTAATMRRHRLTHTGLATKHRCPIPECVYWSYQRSNVKIHLGSHCRRIQDGKEAPLADSFLELQPVDFRDRLLGVPLPQKSKVDDDPASKCGPSPEGQQRVEKET